MKLILPIVLMSIVINCNKSPTTPNNQSSNNIVRPISELNLTITLVDFQTKVPLVDSLPPNLSLHLKFIKGNLYGDSTVSLLDKPIDSTRKWRLLLNDSIFTDNTQPSQYDTSFIIDGLTVSPPETRFGRLYATSSIAIPPDTLVGTGFLEPSSKTLFYVAYFDRACTISGTLLGSPVPPYLKHNIIIPAKGFYCLSESTSNIDTTIVQSVNVNLNCLFAIFKIAR